MKKRILAVVLTVCLISSLFSTTVMAEETSAESTELVQEANNDDIAVPDDGESHSYVPEMEATTDRKVSELENEVVVTEVSEAGETVEFEPISDAELRIAKAGSQGLNSGVSGILESNSTPSEETDDGESQASSENSEVVDSSENDPEQNPDEDSVDETYIFTANEEVTVSLVEGTNTIKASLVPEESGYYNCIIDHPGIDTLVKVTGFTIKDETDRIIVDYDYDSSTQNAEDYALIKNYTLSDNYLVAGKTYYYEIDVSAESIEDNEETLSLTVSLSENPRPCGEGVYWDLNDAGTLTVNGTGSMDSYKKTVDGYVSDGVTPWINKTINQVVITSGVTNVGAYSFYNVSTLTDVIIESEAAIDESAFRNSGVEVVSTSNGGIIQAVGEYAFSCCGNLRNIELNDSLSELGNYAFNYCSSLASITIPGSIETIGNGAFSSCTALETVTLDSGIVSVGSYAFSNNTSLKSIQLPDTIRIIGDSAFYGNSSLTTVVIDGADVELGSYAFANSGVETVSVTGSGSIKKVGIEAFRNCTSLESIDLDDSLIELGGSAFYNCASLAEIYISGAVSTINSSAFYNCTSLETLTIGEGVQKIDNSAFRNNTNLKNIQLPESIISIESYAFSECSSLSTVAIAGSEVEIGSYAFENSTVETVAVAENGNIKKVGEKAFNKCSQLQSIDLGDELTELGDWAFYNCASLKSVYVSGSVEAINKTVFMNCSALENVTLGKGITSIGENAFANHSALKNINFPESVISIGSQAFISCSSLTDIVIEGAEVEIGSNAFKSSAVESVTVTENGSIKSIDSGAFYNCRALKTIDLSNGIVSIASNTFTNNTSLQNIHLPETLITIGDYAFRGCSSLKSIQLPEALTTIGNYAFSDCSLLANVVIEGPEVEIGPWAFKDSAVETVTVIGNGSIKTIGERAFSNCGQLQSIDLDDTLIALGDYAFSYCSSLKEVFVSGSIEAINNTFFVNCTALETITIGNGVTTIGEGAFANSSSLKNIQLPESLTTIEDNAFNGCSALTNVVIEGTEVEIGVQAFKNSSVETVTVTGNGSIKTIGESAFSDCALLQTIDIDDSLATLGDYAFKNCSSLEEIYVPGSVGTINQTYFYNCPALKKVTLGHGITSIGPYAFFRIGPIENIQLPNTITSIGDGAFDGCSSLKKVIIEGENVVIGSRAFLQSGVETIHTSGSGSIQSIGGYAFYNCKSLQSIDLDDTLVDLGDYAFYSCESLKSIYISPSIQAIGTYTFYRCFNLETVIIEGEISSIGYYAFRGCSSIKEVFYKGTEEDWNRIEGGEALTSYLVSVVDSDISGDQDDICWALNPNGTLYIWGCGIIPEFSHDYPAPWSDYASDITCVVFGTGIISIGSQAFTGCSSEAKYYYLGSTVPDCFDTMVNSSGLISADGFGMHSSNTMILIDNVLTVSGSGGCYRSDCINNNTTKIKNVIIENGITKIGNDCFEYCTAIEDVVIPDSVTEIGEETFRGCSNLNTIEIPDSVTMIGGSAFYEAGLQHISLPVGITEVQSATFWGCSLLTEVILPEGLFTIGSTAFARCKSLKSIILPESLIRIDATAFSSCEALEMVKLPSGLTSLDEYTFMGCSNLTSIYLPVSLTSVGANCFVYCTSLTDVYYAGNKSDWNAISIDTNNEPLLQAEIHYAVDYTIYDAAYAELFLDEIPPLDQLTLEDKAVVEAAREAYNRISADEQANVDAEKLAKLTAAEERIAQLEAEASTVYVVTVSSSGDGISSTIAPAYGGGSYHKGETVTVGASSVSGFTFTGWTVDGAIVSTEPEYTFTVEGDTDLVATYQVKNEVSYSLKITGIDFKVNGIPQNNVYYESFKAGTDVVLNYYGNDTFLRWENSSNQPQSVNPSVTLTMNRNYELRVSTVRSIPGDETSGYYAYVEFISPYDQVMSASTWSSKDSYLSHALPGSVSKSGYSFAGWTMDGENAAGTRDIIASIDASHSYIGLTALMEVLDTPRTVTVFDAEGNTTEKQVNLGKTVTLKAGTVSGKIFKCWALDAEGSIPLSYSAAYSFKVTTDISVYAIYVNAGESVIALPVAASTGAYGFTDGGKNKLSFTGNFDIPEGYTVVEYGLLYGTKASEFTDAETADRKLVYGSENTYVKQQASSFRLKRDSYEYLINVTGHLDNYVYAKAYLVVINNSTGEQEVYYGKMMYGTYNSLTASGSGGEEDNPE